jgi:citrate synthase
VPDRVWITTQEAAQRLGVKPETVYAYVSRGILVSRRNPGGRGSLLDRDQVDQLAAGGRRGSTGERRVHRFRSVTSAVSRSSSDALYYRDQECTSWSQEHDLADSVDLVLGVPPGTVRAAVPPELRSVQWQELGRVPLDRRPAGVVARLAEQGWGGTVDPAEVGPATAGLVHLLVAVLAAPGEPADDEDLAVRVVRNLTGAEPGPGVAAAVDTLLVHLLDHGLTASTTAARAAASARAGLADCLLAGYAALAGRAHGAAPAAVHVALAREVAEPGSWRPDPHHPDGFGHFLYGEGDPRADAVLARWEQVPAATPVLEALDRARSRLPGDGRYEPNVDAAVAVTAVTLGLPPEAGPALFALARTAGLAAHTAEELAEDLLRWRGRAATRASGPETW